METASAPPAAISPDAAFLERLRAGDDAAFEEFVRRESARLLLVARRLLGNEADAQEAVQDAFLSAFRAIRGFDGRSALGTWLHRIAVNSSLMKLRRRQADVSIDTLLPRFAPDGHHAEPIDPWTESADVIAERQETCAIVAAAIDRLPETYRTVLALRDIEQMDTAEAAELLCVTANVVKTRLHRARLALRGLLNEQYGGGSS